MTFYKTFMLLKSRVLETKPVPLSAFMGWVKGEIKHCSYLMRPVNDEQSVLMASAYIQAFKQELAEGGYIFVSKRYASAVLDLLSAVDLDPEVVACSDMEELGVTINLEATGKLWVIVEDDSLSHDMKASRFEGIQEKIGSALGDLLEKRVNEAPNEPTKRVRFMFIELGLPKLKSVGVYLAQMRSFGMGACFVTQESASDRLINELFGATPADTQHLQLLRANTIKVYGAGLKHAEEFKEEYERQLRHYDVAANIQQGMQESRPGPKANLSRLLTTSTLGLALGLSDVQIIDLNK
jgi:hypothetical protein